MCVAFLAETAQLTTRMESGNILILRGALEILPPERKTVSYEFLSQLIAEHLLITCPDVDISAALEIMPCTQS